MSDIKESFHNKVNELREERLDEMDPGTLGRYVRKASDEKHTIQKKAYDNKLEKGDLPRFEKRKKGVNLAMKKLTRK